ncbi:MAG: tRNA (adenosine(37)-N6)-threonylcarbamoyltransferase complex ATPase subunit type 1 TsaE [Pseudomonadota bacterium]
MTLFCTSAAASETPPSDVAHEALARAVRAAGQPVALILPDEAATRALGRALAQTLGRGDAVLLSGTLGAGKSALARATIRARLGDPAAEVPSPSYTLVNVYAPERGPEIWHADLYRLDDGSEIAELGLEEAFIAAITIVEWPDRLPEPPVRRLEIALAHPDCPADAEGEEMRRASIRAIGAWPAFEASRR